MIGRWGHSTWLQVRAWLAEAPTLFVQGLRLAISRRGLLVLAAVLSCLYAVQVLWYVQSIPDLGLRSAFSPTLRHVHPGFTRTEEPPWHLPGQPPVRVAEPRAGDVIRRVGGHDVHTW